MRTAFPLIFLPFALSACLVPQTRDQFVNEAARRVCAAEVACNNVGEDEKWEDIDDCYDGNEDVFDAAWPNSACDDESFDRAAWDDCIDEAADFACDGGFFEGAVALESCRAAEVCSE